VSLRAKAWDAAGKRCFARTARAGGSELKARAAVVAAAAPLLGRSDDARGPSPGAAGALIGRLGTQPGDLVGHAALDAVVRDRAHAAVPLLAGAGMGRALAERLAGPRRRRDHIALGELVDQRPRFALQLALAAVERAVETRTNTWFFGPTRTEATTTSPS
jgi:hypothetical protein